MTKNLKTYKQYKIVAFDEFAMLQKRRHKEITDSEILNRWAKLSQRDNFVLAWDDPKANGLHFYSVAHINEKIRSGRYE